ncbi:hypothetical protein KEM52_001570 [Ascosphaera acerosa]|nr:hypothetical protein KEM52_001570 [Ascosphaera acerosa]
MRAFARFVASAAGIFNQTIGTVQSAAHSAIAVGVASTVSSSAASVSTAASATAAGSGASAMSRTPVYFWGHGGPNIMYDTDHPAFKAIEKLGREITTRVKPRAVVVLSGHWSGKRDEVQINTGEANDLIYDFYGFPRHYYQETFPSRGSKAVAEEVISAVRGAGLRISGVERGLDHGVWSSFKIAFPADANPLTVPLVQLSLYDTEDPVAHYRLGRALAPLREQGVLIIASGMAVHNLRDFSFVPYSKPAPYAASFDKAMKDCVEEELSGAGAGADADDGKVEAALRALTARPDARRSHPHMDHLPAGAGAARPAGC